MTIRVEFFGIPRQRAGVEFIYVEATNLREALLAISQQLPEFARACLLDGALAKGCAANLNGDAFISAGDQPLRDGDTLLILSADAGG